MIGGIKRISKRGVDVTVAYKSDTMSPIYRVVLSENQLLDNIDVKFDFDFNKIMGKRIEFVLYGLGNQGGHPSEFVGDSLPPAI